MRATHRTAGAAAALALTLVCLAPAEVLGQGRGNARPETPAVTLSVEMQGLVRDFYASRPASGLEALPPGTRKNLARGKPLPPGIAKKTAPPELLSRLQLPVGYELVEVGLDVLLVEAATGVIHDVLMDILR